MYAQPIPETPERIRLRKIVQGRAQAAIEKRRAAFWAEEKEARQRAAVAAEAPKPKRGRPKGSKNKPK